MVVRDRAEFFFNILQKLHAWEKFGSQILAKNAPSQ